MRTRPLAAALTLAWAIPAIARPTGGPASTMTTNPDQPAPPHHRPTAQHLRDLEAARILAITPRPPLNIDCTPAQQRAARSDLERAQYRLKCGG